MDELISRQAAIEELNGEKFDEAYCNEYEDGYNDGIDFAVSKLSTLPSVQTKTRWILVTEQLPEANGRYLVTRGFNACGDMWNRVYIINYSDLMGLKSEGIWWDGNVGKSDFKRIDNVFAWMPLPKPYERNEE